MTTTRNAYGQKSTDTLTQRLQNTIKPLRAAVYDIRKLPQTLEVKKAGKVENYARSIDLL